MKNGRAAALAWVVATLLVGGGYVVFAWSRGEAPAWRSLVRAAALAGLYAAYLAWRFRERPGDRA